jgi:hypothetical protein
MAALDFVARLAEHRGIGLVDQQIVVPGIHQGHEIVGGGQDALGPAQPFVPVAVVRDFLDKTFVIEGRIRGATTRTVRCVVWIAPLRQRISARKCKASPWVSSSDRSAALCAGSR